MLDWVRANLDLIRWVALGVVLLAAVYFLVVKRQESKRRAQIYANIRGASVATLILLALGIVISLGLWAIIWRIVVVYANIYHPVDSPLGFYLQNIAGFILGGMVAVAFFLPGFFTVQAGQRAFLTIFGVPFGNVGPGWGWIFPGIMTVVPVVVSAIQDHTDEAEEYITADGIEVFIESEITVSVVDPLLVQGIRQIGIPSYIAAQRKAAVRKFVNNDIKSAGPIIERAMKETPSIEDQVELFTGLRKMKGDITTNGPGTILNYFNQEVGRFGLRGDQVQVETVRFNDRLEEESERVFDEIAGALGLRKDALNKAANAKTFYDAVLKDLGLNLSDLPEAEKKDLLRRFPAYALAAERQGTYQFIDFGTPPPLGVAITTAPPTSPGGTNGERGRAHVNDNHNSPS